MNTWAGKPTKLEKKVHKLLTAQGVEFEVHREVMVEMFGSVHKLTPDIFVPSENLFIEVNGCFVHNCPVCFAKTDRKAEVKRHKDEVRVNAMLRAGYDVDVMWEHEIAR